MKFFFSIIVPVYNVAKFLPKCFDSLKKQSFKDFEVLLVDDGSSDDSRQICDEYADRQQNWRVITQQNKGVAGARNMGLNQAQGRYIVFLDADDFIDKDYLAKVFVKLEEELYDICSFTVRRVDESGRYLYEQLFSQMEESIDFSIQGKEEFLCSNFLQYKYGWEVCFHVFRRELIERISLRFDESIKYAEDIPFTFTYLLYAKNYAKLPDTLYNYTQRYSSISNQYDREGQLVQLFGRVYSDIANALYGAGDDEEGASIYFAAMLHYFINKYENHMELPRIRQILVQSEYGDFILRQVEMLINQKEKIKQIYGNEEGTKLWSLSRYLHGGNLRQYNRVLKMQELNEEKKDKKTGFEYKST